MSKYTCVICGGKFEGYGNNPWPIKEEGRCCDSCNNKVIEKRLQLIRENKNKEAKQ